MFFLKQNASNEKILDRAILMENLYKIIRERVC